MYKNLRTLSPTYFDQGKHGAQRPSSLAPLHQARADDTLHLPLEPGTRLREERRELLTLRDIFLRRTERQPMSGSSRSTGLMPSLALFRGAFYVAAKRVQTESSSVSLKIIHQVL